MPLHPPPPQPVPAAYWWQLPAPSHLPSVPQLMAPWSAQRPCGSAASVATGAQRPGELVRLHAWQVPQPLVSQQTPSVQ
jgi:hypothetical protein